MINKNFNLILPACFPIFFTDQPELYILLLFLGPFDEFAFKIGVKIFNGIDINMNIYNSFDNDPFRKIITFVKIQGADKSFKGITAHRL